jgi:hypothetical protein
MRNARKTAFHAAAQFYCRQLGITCNNSTQPVLIQQSRPELEQRLRSDDREEVDFLGSSENLASPGDEPTGETGGAVPDSAAPGAKTIHSKAGALGFVPPPEEQNRLRQRKMKSRKGANRGMAEG